MRLQSWWRDYTFDRGDYKIVTDTTLSTWETTQNCWRDCTIIRTLQASYRGARLWVYVCYLMILTGWDHTLSSCTRCATEPLCPIPSSWWLTGSKIAIILHSLAYSQYPFSISYPSVVICMKNNHVPLLTPPLYHPPYCLQPTVSPQARHIYTAWTYIHHMYVFNTSNKWSGSSSGHVLLLTPTRLAISQASPYRIAPNLV
jgi:hypothetical protein